MSRKSTPRLLYGTQSCKNRDRLDVGSPYPERTLDTFGFLVGAHSAARQAIVWYSKLQKPWDRLDVAKNLGIG